MGAFIKVIGRRSNTKKVTRYVLDKVTDPDLLVTGIYCDNDINSVEQMKATREHFGHNRKLGKDSVRKSTEIFHITQNFNPDSLHAETGDILSPYQAHEIGIEWAEKMFPNQEVLIATHTDKNHIHNHFVINSSDMATGKKMDISKADLYQYQAYNDTISMTHGFGRFESEKLAERDDIRTFADDLNKSKGITTHKERVKVALDGALNDNSILSRADFENRLKENGIEPYYFAKDKRIGFKIENEQGEIEFKVGGKKLGKTYSLENIDQTLETNHKNALEVVQNQEDRVFNQGYSGLHGLNQMEPDQKNVYLAQLDESKRGTLDFGKLKEPVVDIFYEDMNADITRVTGLLKDLPRMIPNSNDKDRSYFVSIQDHLTNPPLFSKNYTANTLKSDLKARTAVRFPEKANVLKDIQSASKKLQKLSRALEDDPEMQRAKRQYEQEEHSSPNHSHSYEMDF